MSLPKVMKAVLLRGHGSFDQLEYRSDVPVPAPSSGEVLIRVGAAAINNTDINTRIGWYSKSVAAETGSPASDQKASPEDSGWAGSSLHFPRIQGADACGRIVAVGDGVDPGRIGDRVLVDPVLRSKTTGTRCGYLGSERDGAFAEFLAVPSENACSITSNLTDVQLASFPCSYGAAENMLERAQVGAGENVIITGASGGVGSAAVQLAKRRGATVLAVAGRSKAAAVKALGALEVLDRESDLISRFGLDSIDVAIDVVGGRQFPRLLEILKPGGRYAVAGAIAGPVVELDLRTLYLKDLRLIGCTVLEPGVFQSLIRYIERCEIKALVSATYPMAEIVAAQEDFLTKSHVGKIVLVP